MTLRIATSFIALDQAKKNLALEIRRADTFDNVRGARPEPRGTTGSDVVEVEGATDDQLTTLYSNLYRLEPLPEPAVREHRHRRGAADSTQPGAARPSGRRARRRRPARNIVDGKIYVNNGFWDTYRTVVAGATRCSTRRRGEIVDGFVQQYRDGGWVARWSSPGYADLMTGTSSDVAFADAYIKGVKLPDPLAAYDAAVKNATVAAGRRPRGSAARGSTRRSSSATRRPTPREGVSWALEGYVNDFGIGNMAAALARTPRRRRRRAAHRGVAVLPAAARTNYVQHVRPDDRLLPGPRRQRRWQPPRRATTRGLGRRLHRDRRLELRLPRAAGRPGPGQPLRRPGGARDKLDKFFATPETATTRAGYGGTIHEMLEARDVRMGQLGPSNQVVHHIPYMYD